MARGMDAVGEKTFGPGPVCWSDYWDHLGLEGFEDYDGEVLFRWGDPGPLRVPLAEVARVR